MVSVNLSNEISVRKKTTTNVSRVCGVQDLQTVPQSWSAEKGGILNDSKYNFQPDYCNGSQFDVNIAITRQEELITEFKKVVLQVSSSANMLTTGLAAEKRQRGSGSRGHSPSKY